MLSHASDIALLFGDEAEALTHLHLAHAWAMRGADPRIQAPGQAKKVAMIGALEAATREVIVRTSRTKRSSDFVALLAGIDRRHGPQPGRAAKPAVLVLDDGPLHASRLTTKALGERPWLRVERLLKHAPELNDVEPVRRGLKRHHLAHQTFTGVDDLEATIRRSVAAMNRERMPALSCDSLQVAA